MFLFSTCINISICVEENDGDDGDNDADWQNIGKMCKRFSLPYFSVLFRHIITSYVEGPFICSLIYIYIYI